MSLALKKKFEIFELKDLCDQYLKDLSLIKSASPHTLRAYKI